MPGPAPILVPGLPTAVMGSSATFAATAMAAMGMLRRLRRNHAGGSDATTQASRRPGGAVAAMVAFPQRTGASTRQVAILPAGGILA